MNIFITGGAGFIGAHLCVEALTAGHTVTVFDNFCNSGPQALERVADLTGRVPKLVRGDVRDVNALQSALAGSGADTVIHLAGLKAVGDSVKAPLDYFATNVQGTANLLSAMQALDVRRLVFSSSATVYGDPVTLPLREDHRLKPTNPYGRSKLMAEWLCQDFRIAQPKTGIAILRYFNPVGAHPSGLLGEDPTGMPNNLVPFVSQVAAGKRASLSVHGGDYDTPDGTGVRDYIHILDLAAGHLAAIERLRDGQLMIVNLGTGQGASVLEVVRNFEQVSGRRIPYSVGPRRPGDIAMNYADAEHAAVSLGWRAVRDLRSMCADAWRWQQNQSAWPSGNMTSRFKPPLLDGGPALVTKTAGRLPQVFKRPTASDTPGTAPRYAGTGKATGSALS